MNPQVHIPWLTPPMAYAMLTVYVVGFIWIVAGLLRKPKRHADFFTHTKAAELLATGRWKLAPDDPHQCWVGMVRLERLD